MEHTKEEILHALHIIKDECKNADCQECPFGTSDRVCRLRREVPELWDVKTEPEQDWRAFE